MKDKLDAIHDEVGLHAGFLQKQDLNWPSAVVVFGIIYDYESTNLTCIGLVHN